MKSLALLSISVSLLPAVLGQQSAWGQCGGQGWTGPTTCVSGYTCVYSNPWYSQCIPGSATGNTSTGSSTRPTSSSSTSRTSSSTSSAPGTSGTGTGKFWFSFGDSYTQTGFSYSGTQPSNSNPFGNPTYPGNTPCGSNPNWIDYAATTYNSGIVKVYNHAFGGATIDASIVAPWSNTVKTLVGQVNDFLNYNAPGKTYYPSWSSSNTLFSVWIGINDIGQAYWRGSVPNMDTLMNRYFQLVQSMYNVGARHFLFLTVPPVQRSPLMLGQGSTNTANQKAVIADYNAKLKAKAASWAASNAGATALVYDTSTVVNAILDNPSAYGLRDATSYGSGNTYAWCDNYHISPVVHKALAADLSKLIKGTYI
ncbi:SubName: Full=Uncharacterized protein {ECO:0000313/EMBL:CCA73365.1} [Serendipita indica DSM 11827]|nr:SubName: Full=Uncharacterized protein {ECO:0000313/EMBL:CCA73365.1} [Serendipita indica DSM 11827]